LFAGVPNEVVQRADTILEDIHSKRPTRRMISEKLEATEKQYQVHNLLDNDI
jgi:DNA mismatch repair protein MSH5